jgi:hypothetical protein
MGFDTDFDLGMFIGYGVPVALGYLVVIVYLSLSPDYQRDQSNEDLQLHACENLDLSNLSNRGVE